MVVEGEKFDIILNMEVVEYVVDVDFFIIICVLMVKFGGMMFVVMINCIMKVMVLVIIGVEYVFCWLFKGMY